MANRTTVLNWLGLDPRKQLVLFGLRARLTWRQFMREPGQIAGILGFLAFFLPVSLGLGIGSAAGYLFLDAPWPGEILGAILTLVWLIWILAPLLSYRLNEGLDLTRLLVYPIRGRDVMAAGIAGTVFDLPSYLTLPVVIAVFVGWFSLPVLPIIILAMLIWYAQLMITSQMVLHASGGLLRSRRFRDISIVIFSLFGMSCYFISQFFNYLMREISAETFQNFSVLFYIQWTPPGATARAIERAAVADWNASILWLLLAALWLIPLGWGWRHITTRLLTGSNLFGGSAVPAQRNERVATPRTQTKTSAPGLPNLLAWIPFPIRQLARKELSQTWRVPQRRINMLQGLMMPLIFAVIWGINPWSTAGGELGATFMGNISSWMFLTLPGYTVLAVWAIAQNTFGWEGPGLQTLLLTPMRRRTIFAGKSLGLFVQIVGVNALLALMLGLVTETWWVVPGWIASAGVALAGFTVTMPASVRFAHPVNLESTSRNATSTGGGCITGLVNGIGVPVGIVLVNLPVAALFAFIYWQNLQWMIWPAGFMSLGYGLALFGVGLTFAERLLLSYEPELIEATSKPGNA